ncbi:MAG TPA: MFS transporter [Chitinophaga sp.]|uniref:MFS transporter n=1 Tax=Chitinophaga sp. TaxID=1869181 RepID=UPI002BA5EDA4|nr:MFS transporter [Chitinophaga sp.]HVI46382.1 MFS transporter [Chitinophaga sp.]
MRQINEKNRQLSTILAFTLIPMSGLATDVYIPSFPEMAQVFHTSHADIQRTMIFFFVSYGISQFFVGTVLDSFGRYRLNLLSLLVFTLSNFVIVYTRDIHMVYAMRIIQGICTAFIVVGKRAFFVDVYTGEKQKQFTSMLTVVWATAPIIAPFLGGYLQKSFGWASNFYLLGIYGALILLLESLFSGESLKVKQPFHPGAVMGVYKKLLTSADFSSGILVLGLSYTMVMLFTMSAPFIVEHRFHLTPVTTGYCALFSGMSLLIGGTIGRTLRGGSLYKKLFTANILQCVLIVAMYVTGLFWSDLVLMMSFVVLIHILGGFMYNLFFTYCLTRFPMNAGVAGGVTSGGSYLVTSVGSTVVLAVITVTSQQSLAVGYLVMALLVTGMLVSLMVRKETRVAEEQVKGADKVAERAEAQQVLNFD